MDLTTLTADRCRRIEAQIDALDAHLARLEQLLRAFVVEGEAQEGLSLAFPGGRSVRNAR